MQVISNTSPIVNLAAIGQLHLLRALFGTLLIPDAVYHEIVIRGAGRPGAQEVKDASWITPSSVENRRLVQLLEREVHLGEAEALALAVEKQADWVLLDEQAARELAASLTLRYTGLLGILERAKRKGLIDETRPLLDALRSHGFWMSDALYDHILTRTGENR